MAEGLIKPLSEYEEQASRFSRARMAPVERRVRVTQEAPQLDKEGRAFMTFAIDSRHGRRWREGAIVGCAYLKGREIFVKIGDVHRPASHFLGKRVAPVSGVCEEAHG